MAGFTGGNTETGCWLIEILVPELALAPVVDFAVGDLVVNFGQPARVVGFWASTGELILRGIGGGAAGTKWCADPAKCRPAI